MFQDLVQKAKNHGDNVKSTIARREEVNLLLRKTVKNAVPQIKELGFIEVNYRELSTSFTLSIRTRNGYDESRFSQNMELSSTSSNINYGYGANSAKGKQMKFDYNWNDSQLVGIMNNALRALVSDALKDLEVCKVHGWA